MQPLLEELLACTICLDTYTDPKQLQCHHVFCLQCLLKLGSVEKNLTCPICDAVTSIPNGVKGLPAAFQTNQFMELLEIVKSIKASPVPPTPPASRERHSHHLITPVPATREAQLLAKAQLEWRLKRHHKKRRRGSTVNSFHYCSRRPDFSPCPVIGKSAHC